MYEAVEENWLLHVLSDERGHRFQPSTGFSYRDLNQITMESNKVWYVPFWEPVLCHIGQANPAWVHLFLVHRSPILDERWLHPSPGPSLIVVGQSWARPIACCGGVRPCPCFAFPKPHRVKGYWLAAELGHPFLGAGVVEWGGTFPSSLNVQSARDLKTGNIFSLLCWWLTLYLSNNLPISYIVFVKLSSSQLQWYSLFSWPTKSFFTPTGR